MGGSAILTTTRARSFVARTALLALAATTAIGVVPLSTAHAETYPDPIAEAAKASAKPGVRWKAPTATYGSKQTDGIGITMTDGTVLRASVAVPTNLKTGKPAAGKFPVLFSMGPYGNDAGGVIGSAAVGIDPWFVKRGYIYVSVDARGTGASQGSFDLFDPQQTKDGVALVKWAAKRPHSNGKVGMMGASYLGINQLQIAAAIGKHSPLKAIFPIVAANDVYRDTAFMGGIPDAEFDVAYFAGIVPLVSLLSPIVALLKRPQDLLSAVAALTDHLQSTVNYNAKFLLQAYLGGADSYDNAYWKARAPQNVLKRIVANKIPAYLVSGEYDIFQRGGPLNFAGLQNAWAHRKVTAPMKRKQKVTGRYQLLVGPYVHLQRAIDAANLRDIQLKWYETWLRGAKTGIAKTRTPLHYYDLGTNHYRNARTYPLGAGKVRTYYFSGAKSGSASSRNDGSLRTSAPTARSASDQVTWLPLGTTLCDRSVDQWAMGPLTTVLASAPPVVPCLHDDRVAQIGPDALTYTTKPMKKATTLAGPLSARIYATANTTETQWVVTVEDVAPNGTSKPLTQGALLGSARAINKSRSWKVKGKQVMPYHPYTKAASKPVKPGVMTRYDIEVFPTMTTLAKGHRLRVTVATNDFPHLVPTPPSLLKLLGGSYRVARQVGAASYLRLSVLPTR